MAKLTPPSFKVFRLRYGAVSPWKRVGTLVAACSFVPATPIAAVAQSYVEVSSSPGSSLIAAGGQGAEQRQTQLVVGVVQSDDNLDHWRDITTRLEAIGVRYTVIDWQQVQRETEFSGIQVLFLPNVASISADQVLALQSWVNRGGGLLLSGATGSNASAGVRRALQSLVGAYWSSTLPQPVQLQPVALNSQRWLRAGETNTAVVGGVLIPTDLASQSVATWQTVEQVPAVGMGQSAASESGSSESGSSVAIVITRQSTFLGWNWGDPDAASVAFDSSWLQATLNRFAEVIPSVMAIDRSQSNQTSRASQTDQTRWLQQNPPELTSPQPNSPPAPTPAPPSVIPPRPDRDTIPPGLVVERGSTPISLIEAMRMRQELENLMGRFESAVLAADAASSDGSTVQARPDQAEPDQAEPDQAESDQSEPDETEDSSTDRNAASREDPQNQRDRRHSRRHRDRANSQHDSDREADLTASSDATVVQVTSSDPATPDSADFSNNTVLQQARQKLENFSTLLQQRHYAAARNEWLAARQLLWDHLPTDRPLAQTEIRAIWLDRETIVAARSKQGLARIFDQLAQAGINTVFFETVNAGYPIYPSTVAPEQNPLVHRWNPLEAAVDLAHERGMELHAWVWTFAAGNGDHNRLVNLPLDYPGPLIAHHPDWAGADNRGSMTMPGQDEPFLDPANPAVRHYLQQLYEEIVTRYDVDGLQLDYIRYPFQDPGADATYGYGIAARQQFQRLTGVDPITLSANADDSRSRQLWQQWTNFRVNQINSFVAETSRHLRQLRPDLVLSAAVFPYPEQERIRKLQQNWEVWAQQGDVDLIVVMTYAADTNRLQQLATPWVTDESQLGSTLVIPGIRLLTLSDAMVFDQIQALRDLSSEGYALFAAAHLRESLQSILNRTQRTPDPDPIPYRQPYAAAARRFEELQREWNFLLSQDQLWLQAEEREDWRNRTEELAKTLQDLAATDADAAPSKQQLQQAIDQMSQYRAAFADWMHLQALTDQYRVQTWQNRLATVETLLSYGERMASRQQNTRRDVSSRY